MFTPFPAKERIRTRGLTFDVATAGAGDRLALLLHGFPETAYSWRHQLPLLARLGYRVWAPDLRGYGHTDRPRGTRHYTIDKLEGDVDDLIEAANPRSVLVVGHDWGGAIAFSHAMHGRRKPDELVVMNAPHPHAFARAIWRPGQLRRSWYMLSFQLPVIPERLLGARHARRVSGAFLALARDRSRFPDEVLQVYRDQAAAPGALTAMLSYYRAMFRGPTWRRAVASPPPIACPTLLLWGEQDDALGLELTTGLESLVPRLTVERLAGVSHWVQQEAPEAVNTALERWLSQPKAP